VVGEGPLVLFLHGVGGNRGNWRRQLEFFSKNYTAAAMDARGYGESDDYEGPLQFDHCTGDVLRVAAYFKKTRKMHLVGLSMGGRIARNVALHHPDWLLSVTLADTSPGFDALSSEQVRTFLSERKGRTAESMRRLLGSNPAPGAYDEMVRSFHALHQESYYKTIEASIAQDRAAPLERIRTRTLVLVGSEDTVYPPQMSRDIARRIPGSKFVEIEGAGHLSNLDQPERFNKIVLDFLTLHRE